jgi:hypothetical protein
MGGKPRRAQSGPAHGFFLCNELPDAFPVHLVRWDGEFWRELHVDAAPSNSLPQIFHLQNWPWRPENCQPTSKSATPSKSTSPCSPGFANWPSAAFRGAIFIADYGLDAEEFFADTRASGTIRRYKQHHMDDRVLEDLGECDLTTHINFTRLIEEASRQRSQAARIRPPRPPSRPHGDALAEESRRQAAGCSHDAAVQFAHASGVHGKIVSMPHSGKVLRVILKAGLQGLLCRVFWSLSGTTDKTDLPHLY